MHEFKGEPKLIINPDSLVAQLTTKECLYHKATTPLIINNRTEPFLNSTKSATYAILDELITHNVSNPILIISKLCLDDTIKQYFSKLNIAILYSYSNVNSDINYTHFKKDITILKQHIPSESLFHYFRPIIPNINDNLQDIYNVLDIFRLSGFAGSIVSGFRITESNKRLLRYSTENIDRTHKFVDNNLYDFVWDFSENFSYPIFRHTSCIVGLLRKERNMLGYFNKKYHCNKFCPNVKQCNTHNVYDSKVIEQELNQKFGSDLIFTINSNEMKISSPVSQEITAYIKNAYGIPVKADTVILSPSEKILTDE